MERHYFLSRFEGDGTSESPYRPCIARYATKFGFIDFRRDQSVRQGWCIAAAEFDAPMPTPEFGLLADLEFLAICSDPRTDLPYDIRDRLRTAIDLPFRSTTLVDILVEVQLLYSNLRPNSDGIYSLCLLGELWSASESEAFAIAARHLFPHWDRMRQRRNRSRSIAVEAIRDAIFKLQSFADYERPGWTEEGLQKGL